MSVPFCPPTVVGDEMQQRENKSKKKFYLVIGGVVLLLLVLAGAGIGVYFGLRGSGSESGGKTTQGPKILIIGGLNENAMSSMELYHPFNPQLNHVINVTMIQGRMYHTSALMDDGTVITVGGWGDDGYDGYLSSCERFTPSTSTVTQCPSLNTARDGHGSSVLNGVLYVCGGYNGSYFLESCERLLSNGWQDSVSMNIKRFGLSLVSLNGYLYAIGGDDGYDYLSSVERLVVTDSHWTFVQSMNNKRSGHSSAVMDGKIVVCGGIVGNSLLSSCELYDSTDNSWLNIAQMNMPRRLFGMVCMGGNLFAVGGSDSLHVVEMYDGKHRKWKVMQKELIFHRMGHSAVLIGS